MRRSRFTYIGAFHHVMNRGHNGSVIFPSENDKKYFLSIMCARAILLKIKIFAYCIMDNHYHIILQNFSGKLSDFLKHLNSIYATYFRKKYGGRGYVFQDRFKSTLIQNEQYLLTAICYTLLNPIRANIADSIFDYSASSANEYFSNKKNPITDTKFVENLIQSKKNLLNLNGNMIKIKEKNSRMGKVLGDDEFIEDAKEKFNRRIEQKEASPKRRIADIGFKTSQKVIHEFEKKENIHILNINTHKFDGKRLRLKLLIKLREEAGLRYSEINRISIFQELNLYSLSTLYNRSNRK